MTHNHNSPQHIEQPEGKHNLGIAYANKQGVNYPLDNNYKEMIKSQIREAYYSGYEAASQPGESVDALGERGNPCFWVKEIQTGKIHLVRKYILTGDGDIDIWSDTWYGHHRIGQDCEWDTDEPLPVDAEPSPQEPLTGKELFDAWGDVMRIIADSWIDKRKSISEVVTELDNSWKISKGAG